MGITFEASTLNTHAQNGRAERFKRIIIKKARAKKLSVNLTNKLWRKIVAIITYLYNCTLQALINQKSPYKAFYTYIYDKKKVSEPCKSLLYLLKAYEWKCYVLIKSKSDPQYQSKRQKHNTKAHIGFLMGYESINIYRVQIPYKKKVTSVKNITFDKDKLWDGKRIQISIDNIKKLNKAIEMVELPQSEEIEDLQLREDPEVESSLITRQTNHKVENLEADLPKIDKQVEDKDLKQF